ncbi:MAG: CoA transferase [Bacteriovoracaceae bacterium]|nr:CoA transferase [Bacteriovoracaceae bacterium]
MILDKALDHINVLDLTRLLPGPLCTRYLSDMGAKVTKVEDKDKGDYARYFPPLDKDGVSLLYKDLNSNKTIINLDLKDDNDLKKFEELVQSFDVIVEGFRPGVMDSLNLSFEKLKKLNPKIILCSITGYGQSDSLKTKAGHDINYMGLSGLLSTLETNQKIPTPGFHMADIAGGTLMALTSITSALHQVAKTNKGLHLDISMTHGLNSFLPAIQNQLKTGAPGIITGEAACYNTYRTKDEKFMALGAVEKKFWVEFCKAIEKPDWVDRHPGVGSEYSPLSNDIQTIVSTKSREEWTTLFKEVDACFTPVLEPLESYSTSNKNFSFPIK